MGFETNLSKVKDIYGIGLKYPYGIWNQEEEENSFFKAQFEVSLWDLKQQIEKFLCATAAEFEVSLWDLKHGRPPSRIMTL